MPSDVNWISILIMIIAVLASIIGSILQPCKMEVLPSRRRSIVTLALIGTIIVILLYILFFGK